MAHVSKVRYCFAKDPRDDACILNVQWNQQSVEASGASANSKYLGMGIKSGGGGPFFVHKVNDAKRFGPTKFSLHGHTDKITDSDFHPFNDDIVATGSLDCTIKLWRIPDGGLTAHLKTPLTTLEGHSKRILFTTFNPSANNVLASASSTSQNEVKVWDISVGEPIFEFDSELHSKMITDMKWNYDGSMLATACKDKLVRVFDPRSEGGALNISAHDSLRPSKLLWLRKDTLLTTGFTGSGKREAKLWDVRNTKSPVGKSRLSSGSAPMYGVHDRGTNIVLFTSKGSTSVKVWEYVPSSNEILHCASCTFKEQCRGFAMLPKRALDTTNVEVARMMWIGASKIQPLSFRIPRKVRSQLFHVLTYLSSRSFDVLTNSRFIVALLSNIRQRNS